jgi:hypothetical protein
VYFNLYNKYFDERHRVLSAQIDASCPERSPPDEANAARSAQATDMPRTPPSRQPYSIGQRQRML